MIHEKGTMDFSEIYQRYAHDVHRFSLYLSGNYALAEDLTAETLVQMCGPTDLRVDSVKVYLFAIARNLFRDIMERQRRLVGGQRRGRDGRSGAIARSHRRRPPDISKWY